MRITHSAGANSRLASGLYTAQRLEQTQIDAQERANSKRIARQSVTANNSSLIRSCGGVVLALLVGTGGAMTADFVAARESRGYRLPAIQYAERRISLVTQVARAPSASEKLAYVRDSLKAPVTDLAAVFGVSRQAIYNWQAGEAISAQNEELLQQLVDATSILQREGITSSSAIKRKLPGGMTLLEMLRSGEPGESAARSLASMIQKESRQRESIARRLERRSRTAIDLTSAGTPHLDERA